MKKYLRQNNGITLIALVITIIVLLILAGITIAMLVGENGLLQRATNAKTNSDDAQIIERIRLAYNSALTRDLTNGNGDLTKPTLDEEINIEFGSSGKVIEDGNDWVITVNDIEFERIPATKEKYSAKFKPAFMQQMWSKTYGPTNIKAIIESTVEPDITDTENILNVGEENSEPIYMWFNSESKILYWWSNDKTPSLPEDCSSHMFANSSSDLDISGMANWDASTVHNMSYMFEGAKIVDFSPIANWNISNVTDLTQAYSASGLKDFSFLANWDVSKVTNFRATFSSLDSRNNVSNVSAINNWNITNGNNFAGMFGGCAVHPDFNKCFGLWSSDGASFYPMTLELNGGTINSSAKVINDNNDSTKISEITGIEKDGYTLTWYTNSELTQQAMFPLEAYDGNVIHLYAKWE